MAISTQLLSPATKMAFKSLVSVVSEQCQEIKQALASFAYFETWDSDVIGECCRVSSVSEFPPDKIILGPDTGNSHTVYFILEGVCKMVQHVQVKVKTGSRKTAGVPRNANEILRCRRFRCSNSKGLNSESKNEGFKSRLLNRCDGVQAPKTSGVGEELESRQTEVSSSGELKERDLETDEGPRDLAKDSEGVEENAVGSGEINEAEETITLPGEHDSEFPEEEVPVNEAEATSTLPGEHESAFPKEEITINEAEAKGNVPGEPNSEFPKEEIPVNQAEGKVDLPGERDLELPKKEVTVNQAEAKSTLPEEHGSEFQKKEITINQAAAKSTLPGKPNSEFPEEELTEPPEVTFEPDHHLKVLEECKKKRNETISFCIKDAAPEKRKNVRSVFMQVGFLLKGACFGLEKSESFIITTTKVKCLKIPQRFLIRYNPRNIWNRIRLFHTLHLPKDERVFDNFLCDRLWIEGKKALTKEIVSKKNIPNYTLDSDVPYSIRLVEMR